MIKIP